MSLTRPATRKKSGGTREGRGFSRGELKKVGVSPRHALRAGLPIDLRRRTVHEENLELLTQRLERVAAPKTRRPKPKKS
jgi:large subunit ribosomal protein L13e